MATVEEKLQNFTKLVYDNIKEEKQKEIDAFEIQKKEKIEVEKHQLEIKEKETLDEIRKREELKAGEAVAKEKLDKQKKILKLKEKCVQETIAAIEDKLNAFVDSGEYGTYLVKVANEMKSKLADADYTVYLIKKDIDKHGSNVKEVFSSFKGGKVEIQEAKDEIMGGIVIEDTTGRFRVDNSLATILEDNREYIGLKVMERLE